MKKKIAIIYLIIVPSFVFCQQNMVIEFINGQWFNGQDFESKTFFNVDGYLTSLRPIIVDTVINLENNFVIPPFGDAHTHNFDRSWQIPFLIDQYLKEGVYYAQLLNNKLDGATETKPNFNNAESIDLVYSHMGITGTLGHPFMAYEPYEMGLSNPKDWNDKLDKIIQSRLDENNSYVFIDQIDQLEDKWDIIEKANPDVIKIYLLDTENRENLLTETKPGFYGLREDIAAEIIKKAHDRKLLVYAHIETKYDFELGVEINIDAFAHMPGYGWDGDSSSLEKYYVGDALIKRAIGQNIIVIPTITQGKMAAADRIQKRRNKNDFVVNFLNRYHINGGKIAIGSDIFGKTLKNEIQELYNLGVFDNLTIIKILCEQTPQTIFPKRKIGLLKDGFEANFLVLSENPIINFESIFNIELYIKEGKIINRLK